MRHGAMAPHGVTDWVVRTARIDEAECLRPCTTPASCRFVLGRSLVVCTVLAAGFTGAVMALSAAQVEGVGSARAATPILAASVTAAAPKPIARFTPDLGETVETTLAAVEASGPEVEGRLLAGRPDRVPYELLIPELNAPGPRDPEELLQFGPMRIRRHLVETIINAAKATDADPVLLMAIADKESSFSTAVKAKTSSATGLFQFIERTWLSVVREFGARHGLAKEAQAITLDENGLVVADDAERERILDLRRDPYLSALLAAEMLKRDGTRIARRIGRDLTQGETYLAHFLGPDDAERFMEKVVEEPKTAAAKLLPRPARANRPIFFSRAGRKARSLSVADVHQKFESMMGLRLDRYRNVHAVAGGVTAYAETASAAQ